MRRGYGRHAWRFGSAWSPSYLYADGSQGAWYDNSNMSTLFQDSAGTTPAVLESPVGLQLDLSKGLVLGSELVTNGTFDTDTGWVKGSSWTISGGSANHSGIAADLSQAFTVPANTWYLITCTITTNFIGAAYIGNGVFYPKPGTTIYYVNSAASSSSGIIFSAGANVGSVDNISVKQIAGNHRSQATSANRPLLSARYNLLLGTAALATQSITTVATSYTIYFTGAGTVTLSGTFIGVFSAGTNTFTATAGALTATVVGSVLTADIRPTDQKVTLPAYQSVTSSTIYDTVNFPQYIRYNGSNQFLSTASIDFTATAQMSVFAGVRRLVDTANGMVCELSVSWDGNNGTYGISGGTAGAGVYRLGGRGLNLVTYYDNSPYVSPLTNTISSGFDLTGATKSSTVMPRINGVLTQTGGSGTTAGGGNFGNYPIYFGMRAGTSLPFNGQEYQMIIVGKTLSAAQITSTETFVNNRTKAY